MAKQRLEWLDALRGFTMLLVVTNHVYGFGFETNTKYSMFMSLCLLFRMPLFFFISGFLAYKASFSWSAADTGRLVARKLRVQVVPTLVFMTAYVAIRAKHFWPELQAAWESPMKGGYWFTLVLLEMFLVYYLVEMASRRSSAAIIALWAVSVAGYATMYMPSWFAWPKDYWLKLTSITELVRNFHFFLLGNIVHRYWDRVQRLLDSRWFFPLIVAVAFVGAADYLRWHNLRMQWANLPRTLAIYALVMMIVAFFRHYASWFGKDRAVGVALQYIGVRTLDIYLIHYFFIPKLPEVGTWFKAHPGNFVIEGTAAIAVGVIVVAFALLTSQVLRVSPVLTKWLFGREQPQTAPPAEPAMTATTEPATASPTELVPPTEPAIAPTTGQP